MPVEPTLEEIRERVIFAAEWHKDVSELEKVMALHVEYSNRPTDLTDNEGNLVVMNWSLDLIRRVARLDYLHYLIESDPPLADAMQHPVVPPEPKRLAGIFARNYSAIPEPHLQSLLQRALVGQPVVASIDYGNAS